MSAVIVSPPWEHPEQPAGAIVSDEFLDLTEVKRLSGTGSKHLYWNDEPTPCVELIYMIYVGSETILV